MIINAAANAIFLGTKDEPVQLDLTKNTETPTHLMKFFIQAEKGPTTPVVGNLSQIKRIFGENTFDPSKKWYNNSTYFLENILETDTLAVVQRVLDESTYTQENLITIWLDIIEDDVPLFEKTDCVNDLDINGDPIPTGSTIPGVMYKLYIDNETNPLPKPGELNGGTSTMYPIIQLKSPFIGDRYKDYGIRITKPDIDSYDSDIVYKGFTIPYEIELFDKHNNKVEYVINNLGLASSLFTLSNDLNKYNIDTYLPHTLDANYNTGNLNIDFFKKAIGSVRVFQEHIKSISSLIWSKEVVNVDINNIDCYDHLLTNLTTANGLIDIIFGSTSTNNPYQTYVYDDTDIALSGNKTEVTLNQLQTEILYFNDGSEYNESHIDPIQYITDINSILSLYSENGTIYSDSKFYTPESAIYDVGFPRSTKTLIIDVLKYRKDIVPITSTYIDPEYVEPDETTLPYDFAASDDEMSNAENCIYEFLNERFSLYKESDVHNTPAMRGFILCGVGDVHDGYKTRTVPNTFEVALLAAKELGRLDGKWIPSITLTKPWTMTKISNVQPTFISKDKQLELYNNNVNLVLPFERDRYYIPLLQSIYDDDTSNLNNWYAVNAIVFAEKIKRQLNTEVNGFMVKNQAGFEDMVENIYLDLVNNRFMDLVEIGINVIDRGGFVYDLQIYISGGRLMKTVQKLTISTYRK